MLIATRKLKVKTHGGYKTIAVGESVPTEFLSASAIRRLKSLNRVKEEVSSSGFPKLPNPLNPGSKKQNKPSKKK